MADFNNDTLPDILFTGNMTSCRLYINNGQFSFSDITNTAGLITEDWCTGVSIIDINNDGLLDIHISTAHDNQRTNTENLFFINQSVPGDQILFKEQAKEMGLHDRSYGIQAYWLDYDKDGDLDLFQANNSMEIYPRNTPYGQRTDGTGNSTDILYQQIGKNQNNLPQFKNVSRIAGIQTEGWTLSAAIFDVNNDNYPDIYVANDFLSNDLLYVNNRDGSFTNHISHIIKHQSHNSMGMDIQDLNNDGHDEILILDMMPEDNLRRKTMFSDVPNDRYNRSIEMGYQPQLVRNMLQLSSGTGTFSEIGCYSGIYATDWSWAPLIADFDNDQYRDLYITNGYVKDVTNLDFINYNSSTTAFGSADEKRHLRITEIESMLGVEKANVYFKNKGDLIFEDQTQQSGLTLNSYSNGAAWGDLDNDGDLDIVVNNINRKAFIIENNHIHSDTSKDYFQIVLPYNEKTHLSEVELYTPTGHHKYKFASQRGYLSSHQPIVHFGLGTEIGIDSLVVKWPNGDDTVLSNLKPGRIHFTGPGNLIRSNDNHQKSKNNFLFKKLNQPIIPYKHTETNFNHFKKWPLHYRGYSTTGPIIATGDLNQDGLDDIVIGGSVNTPSTILFQSKAGFISSILNGPLQGMSEDCGICLFDYDKDGDLDVYLAKGSSEFYQQTDRYQDQFYENLGNETFSLRPEKLPQITTATKAVVAADFDNDDDLDLFVGGQINPNRYPSSPQSYLLENEGNAFIDRTQSWALNLQFAGMISAAVANDLNGDGLTDLVVTGEWNTIQIWYQTDSGFIKSISPDLNVYGWWTALNVFDLEEDGDMDLVAGNWGLNTMFQATEEQPVRIYLDDFDRNGALDPVFTSYIDERNYISHPRNTLVSQMPIIRQIAPDYASYGQQTFNELFSNLLTQQTETYEAQEMRSLIIRNNGNDNYRRIPLPSMVQYAPVMEIVTLNVNNDDYSDLLLAGNFHDTEVLSGPIDASNGCLLINHGNGDFTPIDASTEGLDLSKEIRSMATLRIDGAKESLLVGSVRDSLHLYIQSEKR